MTRFGPLVLIFILSVVTKGYSQVAPDCPIAVPICNNTPINGGTTGFGLDDYNGVMTSGCISRASGTIEDNSAWYRFRTGERGQLGFNIGFNANEDWDFALYKTTDCSNLGEPIRCNYFDNSDGNIYAGIGEDPTGSQNFQYDDWLIVEPNEDYYLMINNFSTNNSGFSIQFSGSVFVEFPNTALDCSIVNNLLGPPVIACDDEMVVLDATTEDALSYEWYLDMGMGYQPIPGENNAQLSVAVSAMYQVLVVMPSGVNITSETQVAYAPTPMTFPMEGEEVCLDGTSINLAGKNIEALGDQSENEFNVTYHETLEDAFSGSNALPTDFIPEQELQTIYVRTSSIENGGCFDASQTFEIVGFQLPNLDFDTEVFICGQSPIATIGQRIPDANYSYMWDNGQVSSEITVTEEGVYTLSVTNNNAASLSCISVRSVSVSFSKTPEIKDIEIEYFDDSNLVTIFLEDEGNYEFQLDDSPLQTTAEFTNVLPGEHTIKVYDINGCGSDEQDIIVVDFPKFFTPNSDGKNDTWKVGGIYTLRNPVISIFDQYGKLLYQMTQDSAGWDGSLNGSLMPAADYWFKLTYTNLNGEQIRAKYINNHFTLKR